MSNNNNSNSKISMLKYYIDLALEFRLSLSDLCKLLGKEDTIENKTNLYNTFLNEVYSYDSDKKQMMNYLFNFESLRFPSQLNKARAFDLYRRRVKPEDAANYIKNRLYQTEMKYNNVQERTIEDIARLRLKHCISRSIMAKNLNMRRDTLAKKESEIQDIELKQRLECQKEFFDVLTYKTYRDRRNYGRKK